MANIIADLKAVLSIDMDARPFKSAEDSINSFEKSLTHAQQNLTKVQKELSSFKEKQASATGALAKAKVLASKPSGISGKQEKQTLENITKSVVVAKQLADQFVVAKTQLSLMNNKEKEFISLQQQLVTAMKRLSEGSSSQKVARPGALKEVKTVRKTFAEIEALQKQHIINTAVQDKEGSAQIRADADKLHKALLAKQKESGSTSLKIEKDYKKAIEEVNKSELDFKELTQKTLISSELDASKKRTSIKLAEARRQMALDKRVQKLSRDAITKTVDNELSLLKAGKGKSATLQKQYDEIIATSTNKRLALLKLEDSIRARVSKNALRDLTRRLTYEHSEKAILEKLASVKKVLGVETEIAEVKASAAASKSHAKAKEAQFDLKKLNKLLAENKRLRDRIGKQNDAARRASSTEGLKKQAKAVGWLSHNFRDLSSTSVLALGPLSGIGSRISAIGAIAGRTNIKMALLLATIGGGLAIFWKFSKSMVRVRIELESAVNLFEKLRSGGEKVGETFNDLYKLSVKFGISMTSVAKPIARLKASMRGTKLEGLGFKHVLHDILNISGKYQLSGDEVGGVTKAFSQMFSKGAVFAEEFKQQLGDRIPGVFSAGLAAFEKIINRDGVNTMDWSAKKLTATFYKAMKKGQLESVVFIPEFLKQFKRISNIDDSGVNTLTGGFQRLSTTFDRLIYDFDKTLGLTDALVVGLNELSKFLERIHIQVVPLGKAFKVLMNVGLMLGGLKIFKASGILRIAGSWKAYTKGLTTSQSVLKKFTVIATATGGALLTLGGTGWIDDIISGAKSAIKVLTELFGISSAGASEFNVGINKKSYIPTSVNKLNISEKIQPLQDLGSVNSDVKALGNSFDTVSTNLKSVSSFGESARKTVRDLRLSMYYLLDAVAATVAIFGGLKLVAKSSLFVKLIGSSKILTRSLNKVTFILSVLGKRLSVFRTLTGELTGWFNRLFYVSLGLSAAFSAFGAKVDLTLNKLSDWGKTALTISASIGAIAASLWGINKFKITNSSKGILGYLLGVKLGAKVSIKPLKALNKVLGDTKNKYKALKKVGIGVGAGLGGIFALSGSSKSASFVDPIKESLNDLKGRLDSDKKSLKSFIEDATDELNRGFVLEPTFNIVDFTSKIKSVTGALAKDNGGASLGINSSDKKKILGIKSLVKEYELIRAEQKKLYDSTDVLTKIFRLLTSNLGNVALGVVSVAEFYAKWQVVKFTANILKMAGALKLVSVIMPRLSARVGVANKKFKGLLSKRGTKGLLAGLIAIGGGLIFMSSKAKAAKQQIKSMNNTYNLMKKLLTGKGVISERIISGKTFIRIHELNEELTQEIKYLETRQLKIKQIKGLLSNGGNAEGLAKAIDIAKGIGLSIIEGYSGYKNIVNVMKEEGKELAKIRLLRNAATISMRKSNKARRAAIGLKGFRDTLTGEDKVLGELIINLGKQDVALGHSINGYSEYEKSVDKINTAVQGWKDKMREAIPNVKKADKAVEAMLPQLNKLKGILYEINQQNTFKSLSNSLELIEKKYIAVAKGAEAYKKFQDQASIDSILKPFEDNLLKLDPKSEQYNIMKIRIDALRESVITGEAAIKGFGESTKKASESNKDLADSFEWLSDSSKYNFIKDLDTRVNSLGDSLADVLTNGSLSAQSFGQVFADMARSMIKDMIALIIKINILKPLMESLSAGAGGFTTTSSSGGLLSGFLGGINTLFSGGEVTKNAIFDGGTGLIDEKGLEAVIPLTTKNSKLGIAGGSSGAPINIAVNVTMNGNGDDLEQLKRELPSVIIKTVQAGKNQRIL